MAARHRQGLACKRLRQPGLKQAAKASAGAPAAGERQCPAPGSTAARTHASPSFGPPLPRLQTRTERAALRHQPGLTQKQGIGKNRFLGYCKGLASQNPCIHVEPTRQISGIMSIVRFSNERENFAMNSLNFPNDRYIVYLGYDNTTMSSVSGQLCTGTEITKLPLQKKCEIILQINCLYFL